MDDSYFDKAPRGPLVSTTAVVGMCLAAAFCAFLGFAAVRPDAAKEIGTGVAFTGFSSLMLYGLFRLVTASASK